jgi:predicted DNA-binding WGR domain protein
MPRYEFSEGTSNKFWQIDLSGKSFTTTYGKIGTAGQTTVKSFKTDAEAKKEYDKLIAEKVKKGYQPADGGGGGGDEDDEDEVDEKPAKKVKAAAKPAAKTATKTAAKSSGGGGMSTPRRFEFSEGTSNKFWTVWVEGTQLMTKYGKIGSAGSQTVKDFGTDEKVKKEYDKIVAEKTKKGYQEVEGGDDD